MSEKKYLTVTNNGLDRDKYIRRGIEGGMAAFTLSVFIPKFFHIVPPLEKTIAEGLFAAAAMVVTGAMIGKIAKDSQRRKAIKARADQIGALATANMRLPVTEQALVISNLFETGAHASSIDDLAANIGISRMPKLPNLKPHFKEARRVFMLGVFPD